MTVKECFERLNGNYEDVKSRLMTDKLIDKIILKFPNDDSMQGLNAALEAGNYDEAFRFAHTLKGVSANLGFTALTNASSELTELLRNDRSCPDSAAVEKVRAEYARTIEVLEMYQNERQ